MIIFQQTFFRRASRLLLAVGVFCCFFVTSLQGSYAESATDYGVGRTRSCSSSGVPDTLDFDPTTAGKDVEFVLSNPVCLTVILTTYAAVKTSIAAMNGICSTGSPIPRILPTPLLDAYDITRGTIEGVKKAAQQDYSCGGAVALAVSSWGIAIAQLAIIYGIALNTYNHTEVCGAQWVTANPSTYDISAPNKKQKVKDAVEGYIRDGQTSKLTLDASGDQTYREWYYGGEEVEDNPDGGYQTCYDVTQKVDGKYPKQKYYMRGTAAGNYNCKKYNLVPGNMDPLTNAPVTAARIVELQNAYACCKKRSAEFICLNYTALSSSVGVVTGDVASNPITGVKTFCRVGQLCNVKGITFSTKSLDNGSLICAETYSLCPYNFAVGGGSEYCDYYQDGKYSNGRWTMITQDDVTAGNCSSKSEIRDSDCSYNAKAGKCRNYCQYLTHCTITSLADYQYETNLGSPYFSDACLNFVGDSQNKTAYGGGFILNSQKHFSAPIAQCVKETLENLFYNVAGHSECATTNEYPSADGTCPSGSYKILSECATPAADGSCPGGSYDFTYQKGNKVKATSFFSMVQNTMKDAVKMVLTLSIMFYGMNILLGKANIGEKKDILMYLLKITLVLFFATGEAWQGFFFKGVYGASTELSQMVFKISSQQSESQRDGCQFGMISLPDGSQVSSGRTYPSGKEYLALWDTLDCKMMRYLGYGPEVSVANIASLILAGYFSFNIAGVSSTGVGIYFAIAVMFFGFFFLAATLRALHIFLASAAGIIILIFVSPVIIPTAMFSKTSDIFKKWVTELIGYCLQPMILFAYIALFITIMDKTMIGSATFSGQAPSKTISCAKICKNSDGSIEPYVNGKLPDCDDTGDKILDPMSDSVACLINLDDFGTMPGLEMIGLTIPILMNIFGENGQVKVLTILKGAMVMFLLYKFMSEISGMAARLMGGSELKGGEADPIAMMNKVRSVLAQVQKRAAGASKKLGKKGLEKAGKAREAIGKAGNQGGSKGGGGEGGDPGGDHSESSGSGDEEGGEEGGDEGGDSK